MVSREGKQLYSSLLRQQLMKQKFSLLLFQVLTPSSGFLDFAISMRPDYHQAIIDTIRFYGWTKIIYLYDSNDGKLIGFFLLFSFLLSRACN